jgi:hypothetical protein
VEIFHFLFQGVDLGLVLILVSVYFVSKGVVHEQ